MRPIVRTALSVAAIAALVAALPLTPDFRPASDADRTAWRADLGRLEAHLANAYANFEWTARDRKLDLTALHRGADSAIADAPNRRSARRAVLSLLAAFDDGHLRAWPPPHPAAKLAALVGHGHAHAIRRSLGAGRACRRLGFENRDNGFGVPFDRVDGFTPAADAPFRAGVVPFGGTRIGVVRIQHFGADGYRSTCEAAWPEIQTRDDAPCDDACESRVHQATGDSLLAKFAATLSALDAAGASLLVVDLTGNGGGSNLADAMARELTPIPLRGAPVGMIRHVHARAPLLRADTLLSRDLARADLTPEQRAVIESARGRAARIARETESTCDLTPLWSGREVYCAGLVRDSVYSTGLVAYSRAGALRGLGSESGLFDPAAYAYREAAWTKPVVLVMDGGSASATEQFAALLVDNGAARVVGERTMGVGCGFTNGGIQLKLEALRLTVQAPDCARFRKSGENERAGITPDITVPLGDLNGVARATAVLQAATRNQAAR